MRRAPRPWRPSRPALALFAALVLPGPAAAADLDAIRARGVLRVVVSRDALPELFSLDADTEPGFERELIDGFAQLHRLKVELVEVPSVRERIPALNEGKGDMIAGALSVTESRRRQVVFTAEVLPLRHVVITRAPRRAVTTVAQLREERVGTLRGSSWAEQVAAAGVPADRVDDTFSSPDDVMRGLRAGTVSAVVLSVSWAILEQRKDPQIRLGLFVGPSLGQAWAVRNDQPRLREALDAYLQNVRRTATWSRLVVKYFGESALEILKKSQGS